MMRLTLAQTHALALALVLLAACSMTGGGARSTSDSRVRSFVGQVPPGYQQGGRWLQAPPSHVAGTYSGPRVVAQYVQFAFPT